MTSPQFASKPLQILIIENNPADARLTLEALKQAGMHNGAVIMPTGDEALEYLRREGEHADRPVPHLIFLDLHLPKKPGLVVISELKSDPKLKILPVVVVTGSHDPKEIREAYELHANCVVYKHAELDHFLFFIRSCYEFWGTVATLPSP